MKDDYADYGLTDELFQTFNNHLFDQKPGDDLKLDMNIELLAGFDKYIQLNNHEVWISKSIRVKILQVLRRFKMDLVHADNFCLILKYYRGFVDLAPEMKKQIAAITELCKLKKLLDQLIADDSGNLIGKTEIQINVPRKDQSVLLKSPIAIRHFIGSIQFPGELIDLLCHFQTDEVKRQMRRAIPNNKINLYSHHQHKAAFAIVAYMENNDLLPGKSQTSDQRKQFVGSLLLAFGILKPEDTSQENIKVIMTSLLSRKRFFHMSS